MDSQQTETIAAIVRILRDSRSALFVTGAGLSADSGLPTYRGIGGLYELDETEDGLPIEEIVSGDTLHTNPELIWKYLGRVATAARAATFNRGHSVIAEMERLFPRVWTITQNVDGYHRLAGARNVIELHGCMRSLTCLKCAHKLTITEETPLVFPPRCSECQAIMRPDVVLFGEHLPEDALEVAQRELLKGFDVVFCVGTSGMFPYIQGPILAAKKRGIPTVEINPGETVLSGEVDYRLGLGAAEALEAIWREYLVPA